MTTPIWMIGAPCAGHQDIFFDETSRTKVKKARKICGSCVVKAKCLNYAIESRDVGVWAGTTTNQRSKMRTAMRKKAKEPKLDTKAM